MAMSSITVSGITPSLSILGAFQEFIYNQNSSAFRLSNTFVPLIGTPSVTNFEYRNNALCGFRWEHTTTTTDTIGQLKLQSFIGGSASGTDIISFNNNGTISFYSNIVFPIIFNVNGSSQSFVYSSTATQPVKFDIVNSFIPAIGQDAITNFNFVNAYNYRYQFTHETGLAGIGYGVLRFSVEDDTGAATTIYTVNKTSVNSEFAFADDCIITVPTPTEAYQVTNKLYADSLMDQIYYKEPCTYATTANIAATYDNGTVGIGATLSGTGFLIIDGFGVILDERVLVMDQTNDYENGIYTLTTAAVAPSDPFVLTRTIDYDTPAKMLENTIISVVGGNTNSRSSWYQAQSVDDIGIDSVIYVGFSNNPNIYLERANNLSDLADVVESRENLGLTDIATQTTTEGAVLTGGFGDTIININLPGDPGYLFIAEPGIPGWSPAKLLTANNNFLLGINAGNYDFSNPTGEITAIGVNVLPNANPSTVGNTGVGYHALSSTTAGSYNTALGALALTQNTTGSTNTAIGEGALDTNTIGSSNIAIGAESGNFGTNNNACIFIGHEAASTVDNLSNAIVIGAGATVSTSDTCNIGVSGTDLIIGSGTGNITGLGAVTTGSWQGNIVTVSYGGTGNDTLTQYGLLVGNNTSAVNTVSPGGTGTVLIGVNSGDPVFSSSPTVDFITILNSPIANTDGVNKAYVDALTAGLTFVTGCYVATTDDLSAIYTNGAAGIGATLNSILPVGAFTVDGVSVPLNSRVLVKDQTSLAQNGIYTLTTVGNGTTTWVLTRAADYDQPTDVVAGSLVPVKNGTINAISSWVQFDDVVTIGTDPIDFAAFTFGPMSYLQKLNNLSDLDNISIARTNLGLTDIAIQNVTNNAVLIGGTGNTINSLNLTNGQILIGSTGNAPIGTLPSNGTNISWSGGAGTLTANITGQIALANGGTNANLTASAGGIVYSTASALAILPGASPSNRVLLSNGTNAPFWAQTTLPNVTFANQLLYSPNNNEVSGLETANNGVLITNSSGIPSIGTTLSTTVQNNITSTGTINSGTWQGSPVGVQYGGTGSTFYVPYGVVCGGPDTTSPLQSVGGGLNGYVLVSQGSALPTWKSLSDASIAPKSATYIVQTPDSTLTNEQALSSLSTGLLKNTTGTGVLSTAVAGTDYYVPGANLPVQTQYLGRCLIMNIGTGGQAFQSGVWKALQFLTNPAYSVYYDPSHWWDTNAGTQPTRITPGITGTFLITGYMRFVDNSGGNTCGVGISKNGSFNNQYQSFSTKDGGGRRCANITVIYNATSASDYFEIQGYQDSGSTLNIQAATFSVERLA